MASVSDKRSSRTARRRMALSYIPDTPINSGNFAPQVLLNGGHHLEMNKNSDNQSPPLNNNNVPADLYPRLQAAAAAASLSMLTSHQLLAAQRRAVLFAQSLPVSLQSTLQTNPSLYHQQTMFGSWPPGIAVSPPSPLLSAHQQLSHQMPSSTGSADDNNTSTSMRTSSGSNANNNNVISSSGERNSKKGQAPRKRAPKAIKNEPSLQLPVEGGASPSPPTSISPEVTKDGRDKTFTCGVCSRSFGYKHVLQNHERTHTGEKPFKCKECNKRFTRDHHLKTHMRLHTGEKPYHCNHCDRQFVQVANLRRHLRVHTGEKPYTCDLCNMKFSDSNQLKAHALIHQNEKPFKCEHCHISFRRKHHLMNHKCSTTALAMSIASLQQQRQLQQQQHQQQQQHLQQQQQQQYQRPLSASTRASSSVASDDIEEDVDIPNDIEMGEEDPASHPQSAPSRTTPVLMMSHRQLASAAMPSPYNLSVLPEQTEPEDLSMPARIRDGSRSHTHSHSSGGSPLSNSNSSDVVHDDDFDYIDLYGASTRSLFTPRTAMYNVNVQPKSSIGTTADLKVAQVS